MGDAVFVADKLEKSEGQGFCGRVLRQLLRTRDLDDDLAAGPGKAKLGRRAIFSILFADRSSALSLLFSCKFSLFN